MFEVASGDLAGMGIVVISYTIKEIIDDVGYLKVINITKIVKLTNSSPFIFLHVKL